MKVLWKQGSQVTACTATQAYRFLERNRKANGGEIDIDKAIHDSKPKDAPLHNALTWDKDIALKKLQREEMRYVIRSIEIKRPELPVPHRAYTSIRVEKQMSNEPTDILAVPVFKSVEEQLADPAGRAALLQSAVKDAIAYRKRYAVLSELANLIRAIDTTVSKLA